MLGVWLRANARTIIYALAAVACYTTGNDEWLMFAGAAATQVSPGAGALFEAMLERRRHSNSKR